MSGANDATADGLIVSSRMLAASRDAVFAALSDPARLAAWWGPRDFKNTFRQFEFRTGGAWRFTMHAPDGAAYEMDHQFTEIVPPEKIVVRHFQAGHDFTLTMILVARGSHTKLTWQMRFDDPAEGEKVKGFIVPANEQNFDRLAEHLSAAPPPLR